MGGDAGRVKSDEIPGGAGGGTAEFGKFRSSRDERDGEQ